MKKHLTKILLLGLIVGAGVIYLTYFNEPVSVKLDVSDRPALNILFIGNSYTFFNKMPQILEDIAAHDPDAPFRVETQMLVGAGATLAYLLTRPKTNEILTSKQWHYVVLQPQSLWANTETKTRSTKLALGQWNQKINKIGALPVFFMTWPRQRDTNWYQQPEFSFVYNPDVMFGNIHRKSKTTAKKYDMQLAPVGSHWTHALHINPELSLYNPDGSHPSKQGSLLAALVFHKMLVSETLGDINYYPDYLTLQDRETLFDIADSPLPPLLK